MEAKVNGCIGITVPAHILLSGIVAMHLPSVPFELGSVIPHLQQQIHHMKEGIKEWMDLIRLRSINFQIVC